MAFAIFVVAVGTILSVYSISSEETTTITFDEEFQNVLEEAHFVPAENRTKFMVHKYVHERRRAKKLDADLGAANEKINIYETPLSLTVIRSRLEDIVNQHYPLRIQEVKSQNMTVMNETKYGKPDKKGYCDCIGYMLLAKEDLFTNDPWIKLFRERVNNMNMSINTFMRKIRWVYSQISHLADHKVYFVPVPKSDDVDGIEKMLQCVGIQEDNAAVKVVQIVLRPLDTDDDLV